jgi:oligopeptide transport system ATP-binding protein
MVAYVLGAPKRRDAAAVRVQSSTMNGVTGVKPILEVQDLRTHFFTRAGVVRAVDGISFSVEAGETVGIVGESGCGKSVTALSIMRLIPSPPGRIVSGQILLNDGNISIDLAAASEGQVRDIRGNIISMIFQDPMTSLNPVLTIGYQISEPLMVHRGMGEAAASKHAVGLLDRVGIPAARNRINDYPHQFSGGMRQRVMIAMAMACQPKLLIADEPTTALDVTIQAQILDLIIQLNRDFGTAVILITHDLGVVAELCRRVIVMYAGRIAETAPAEELYAAPNHPYTLGLLRSVPRLVGSEVKHRLVPIRGLPPDLIAPPPGCRFQPRCSRAQIRCTEIEPELTVVGTDHRAACYFPGPE